MRGERARAAREQVADPRIVQLGTHDRMLSGLHGRHFSIPISASFSA
jgi:hypothetical protein